MSSPQPVRDRKNPNEDERIPSAEIVIERTVGEVAAALWRNGSDPHDRIGVRVLSDELIPGRREVIAAGLSDDDIGRLIEEAPYRGAAAPQKMRVVLISAALKDNSPPADAVRLVVEGHLLPKSALTSRSCQ